MLHVSSMKRNKNGDLKSKAFPSSDSLHKVHVKISLQLGKKVQLKAFYCQGGEQRQAWGE